MAKRPGSKPAPELPDAAAVEDAKAQAVADGATSPGWNKPAPELPPMDGGAWLVTAKLVRSYVRATCIQPVVNRLYNIAMGVETFDVPTMTGKIVNVPASANTQVKALAELVKIGVPQQIGLTDEDGNVLPGVFALGELELEQAQEIAHGERFGAVARVVSGAERSPEPVAVPPPELEYVEVIEAATAAASDADPPPPPLPAVPAETPESRLLAKRRARPRVQTA